MTRAFTRILVPLDFSAASEVALEYAVAMASRFGASLHLLHVVDDPFVAGAFGPEVYIANLPGMRVHLIDEATHKLAGLLERCSSVAARSEVRVGSPCDVILEAADEHAADLIVMGTHGRTGMAHLLLGSVAEKTVRAASCPVLTVRGDRCARVSAHDDLAARQPVRNVRPSERIQ